MFTREPVNPSIFIGFFSPFTREATREVLARTRDVSRRATL